MQEKYRFTIFSSLHFDKNSYVDPSGMRVIVGHYVGGNTGGNLSDGRYKILSHTHL